MNKAILFLLFLLSQICNCSAQDATVSENTRNFILSHYTIWDSNPIHKEESDSINLLFQAAMKNFSPKKKNSYNTQVQRVIRKLYDNATGSYEDSNDARRMIMRRSQCFASLALMSDDISEITYLDLALHSLSRGGDCSTTAELMEEQYCSLLFLRIYIEYEYASFNNYAFNPNIKPIRDYILKNSKSMTPGFVSAANSLLDRWEKMK